MQHLNGTLNSEQRQLRMPAPRRTLPAAARSPPHHHHHLVHLGLGRPPTASYLRRCHHFPPSLPPRRAKATNANKLPTGRAAPGTVLRSAATHPRAAVTAAAVAHPLCTLAASSSRPSKSAAPAPLGHLQPKLPETALNRGRWRGTSWGPHATMYARSTA